MTVLTAGPGVLTTERREPPGGQRVVPAGALTGDHGAELVERLLGGAEGHPGPAGHRPVRTARARGATPDGIGLALRGARLGARFVPAALGGSLTGVDALARTVRPVFRRDVAAGLSLGAAPFGGALHVWTAGSRDQRGRLAGLLLDGGGISAPPTARSVREAFAPRGLRVLRGGGGLVLDGECAARRGSPLLQGSPPPDVLLLHATVESPDGRTGGPSVLLVDLRDLPRDRFTRLPGHRVAFSGCPAPAGCVVGEPGGGAELFLRTLQISSSAVSSMSLGAADTCLRIAVERTQDSRLTSRSLSARGIVEIVNGAFLDLLACDCLALAGTRTVAIAPGETSVLSAVVRSVVPMLLRDALQDLAALLGPRSLRHDSADPLFARHTRQLSDLGAGGTGAFIGRAIVLPQLPFLARHAWFNGPGSPGALFDPAGELPAFEPDRVTLLNGSDGVIGLLADAGRSGALGAGSPELTRLIEVLRDELRSVQRHFAAITPGDRSLVTDPRALAMGDRYLLLLTAAACLGRYEQARLQGGGVGGGGVGGGDVRGGGVRGGGFLAGPAWITGILTRLVRRLGLPAGPPRPEDTRLIHAEAVGRFVTRRGFDLYETPLEG